MRKASSVMSVRMFVWCCRPCCSVNLLLLTLVFLLPVCQGSEIIMHPNLTHMKIIESDFFEFSCEHEGFGDVGLSYPGIAGNCDGPYFYQQIADTSECEVQVSSSSLFEGPKVVFQRGRTYLGDTGIYRCFFGSYNNSRSINVTVLPNNEDQDDDDTDDGSADKDDLDYSPYYVLKTIRLSKEGLHDVDVKRDSIEFVYDGYDDDVRFFDIIINKSHERKTLETGDRRTTDFYDYGFDDFITSIPPTFLNKEMNGSIIEAESNSTINLSCPIHGIPVPIITWYKNDKVLEIDKQQFFLDTSNHTLTIKYLTEKDSGKYSCVAKNHKGQLSRFQNIIVKTDSHIIAKLDKGTEVSIPWIIGIAVVVLVIILIALLILFFVNDKNKKSKNLIQMSGQQSIEVNLTYVQNADLTHFEEGDVDCVNPELTVDEQAELLPYNRKWEFPREKLKLGIQLGSGEFGVVMKAEARGIYANEYVTTVAVKMVRRNVESAYIRALVTELKIMVHLGKHLNVVNLLGACTNNIAKSELLVIVEFCRFGNLHNYLLRHRSNFVNQIDPNTDKIDPSIDKKSMLRPSSVDSSSSDESQPGWRSNYRGDYNNSKPIRTQDLLSWAFQVARGMEYLCQRKILHGDLAARNILLAEDNVVKICDFGLAKKLYKDDNYQIRGNVTLPIKWMAIESIRDRVFSTQSDVWSFGIVLWEFFTLAKTPYPGMQTEKLYQRLIDGYRMEKPQYATDDVYDVILECWRGEPTLRPPFSCLVESIGSLLEESVKTHYVEMNAPYVNFNASLECKCDYLKMMSAPDHVTLTTSQRDNTNSPWIPAVSPNLSNNSDNSLDETEIHSPRDNSTEDLRFLTPGSSSTTDANTTHTDGDETPMLMNRLTPEPEQDLYLTPIDVSKRREDFVRQLREAKKRQGREHWSNDRDSSRYYNTKGLELLDVRLEVVPEID